MPAGKVFMLGCVNLIGDSNSAQLNQIQSDSLDTGIETVLFGGDGKVDREFAAVMFQQPIATFSTTAIARALAEAGISAAAIGTDPATADLYYQQAAPGGTRLTGGNSTRVRISKGMLTPRTIDAQDRQIATISYELGAISTDGTTAPLTIAASQTMPTLLAADQAFTVGPASINGTSLGGVQSLSIDFGLQLMIVSGGGEAYPTFIGIATRQPTIRVRTLDVDLAASLQVAAQGATDSVFYLRKLAEGGTRVANATAEHISFSVDDGIITTRRVGGEGEDQPQMLEILVEPTWDGTNDVIAINAATAIT